jgi:hypothetical protein
MNTETRRVVELIDGSLCGSGHEVDFEGQVQVVLSPGRSHRSVTPKDLFSFPSQPIADSSSSY